VTTRVAKLKRFRAQHLVVARPVADDGLAHLRFEYGGSTLCGLRGWSLTAVEAKKRDSCEECEASRAARAA